MMETILESVSPLQLAVAASLLTAGAAFACMFAAVSSVLSSKRGKGEGFEERRRALLREGSILYRAVEPLVDRMVGWSLLRMPAAEQRLAREVPASGDRLPWRPAEYRALRQIEGFMLGCAIAFVSAFLSGNPLLALLLGAVATCVAVLVLIRNVADKAKRRLVALRARLPFAIDLMALMMQAGANFREALEEAVKAAHGTPLAVELGDVLRETNQGMPRRDAFLGLQQRLQDETVSELVFAIVKGEELGTPLADLLCDRAEQMRLRQSQESERKAGEAQVTILFPALVIMVGCMLVIFGPFLLGALNEAANSKGLF